MLKRSDITSKYANDGIQDAGYETSSGSQKNAEESSLSVFKDSLHEVCGHVRRVAGYWDEVTSLWEADELPKDFWGGRGKNSSHLWLHRANNHRMYHEQFDIANYYRLIFNGTDHYVKSRPRRFHVIQQQWVKWGLEKERRP
ncbi:hypothetical protein WJX81_006286 [Elliptochloris bilobata]|uniref:EDS1 EP domain-containing protein n=1 Tax=Elliptochloris bilobata TaxID=381761 RepID=A0AAW1QV27_9CHLO